MNKIKFGLISLFIGMSTFGVLGLATVSASTATNDACAGLTQIDPSHDCSPTSTANSSISTIITAVVSILSYIIGAVAIVMIILAGFKYVTSAGDSNRVSSAKNTLVYALIGLAIAAFAQALVHFVLNQSMQAANGTAASLPAISHLLDTA